MELSADCLEYAMLFRPDMLSFSSYDLTQQQLSPPSVRSFSSSRILASPAGQELKTSLLPLLKSAPAPLCSLPSSGGKEALETIAILSSPMSFSFLNQAGRDSRKDSHNQKAFNVTSMKITRTGSIFMSLPIWPVWIPSILSFFQKISSKP